MTENLNSSLLRYFVGFTSKYEMEMIGWGRCPNYWRLPVMFKCQKRHSNALNDYRLVSYATCHEDLWVACSTPEDSVANFFSNSLVRCINKDNEEEYTWIKPAAVTPGFSLCGINEEIIVPQDELTVVSPLVVASFTPSGWKLQPDSQSEWPSPVSTIWATWQQRLHDISQSQWPLHVNKILFYWLFCLIFKHWSVIINHHIIPFVC